MKSRLLEAAALLAILALAAYLRLANVAHNPGWYTDEGTHLDIAYNLLRGEMRYMAINQSTFLFAKLPLFELVLAGLLDLAGGGIGALRALTGTLGLVSVGLLYWVVRSTQPNNAAPLALLSAAILAICPQAVLYSRLGFSYNLLPPLVLLTFLALWKYLDAPASRRRRWLAAASICIGLGFVTDLWMLTLVVPLIVVASTRGWRDLLWSLPLALLPFGLYAAFMLAAAPQAFLFDAQYTLFRLNNLSALAQARILALNYATLVLQDAWMAFGLVGLFALQPARLQRLGLLFFLSPIVILGRTTALFHLSLYYMIPLFPFVGLGIAALIQRSAPYVRQTVHSGLAHLLDAWFPARELPPRRAKILSAGASLLVMGIIATPFLTSGYLTAGQVRERLSALIEPFLINPDDAVKAADFINARTAPDDLVIATPGLAWLLTSNKADPAMSVAATGQATALLPGSIPKNRFAYDPDYRQAHFVVVDNLWRNWAVWTIAGTPEMLRDVESWPLVFKSGSVEVYCNPAQQPC